SMARRRTRLGIRAQLTLTVLLGVLLSTGATLFIARNAIHNYAFQQAATQAAASMNIAELVRRTTYGTNMSIASGGDLDNKMVFDSPTVGRDQGTSFNNGSNFGKFALDDSDGILYVDDVGAKIAGAVSIYKCVDKNINFTGCHRIATTFSQPGTRVSEGKRD